MLTRFTQATSSIGFAYYLLQQRQAEINNERFPKLRKLEAEWMQVRTQTSLLSGLRQIMFTQILGGGSFTEAMSGQKTNE